MFFLPLIVVVLFNNVFVNAGRLKRSPILGGYIASLPEFSYSVAIIDNKTDFICSGGIIGERYILSAAHCFTDKTGLKFKDGQFNVIAGTNNFKSRLATPNQFPNAVVIAVEEVFIPDDFNKSTRKSDIAVIKLAKNLNTKKNSMKILKLPNKCKYIRTGKLGNTAGFGSCEIIVTRYGDKKLVEDTYVDGTLRYARVEVVEQRECHGKPYGNFEIDENHFLGKMIKNSTQLYGLCYGDSGSLFVDSSNTAIGVFVDSFDKGCDGRFLPSIFIKVPSYVNFIKNATSGNHSNRICVRNLLTNTNSGCVIT